MRVPFSCLSVALVLGAGCTGTTYGFPEPCQIREVDADFVTPWGTLAEVAAASAGPVEIEWNSPGNPIPTSWTLETGAEVIQAGVCEDFDDQLNYLQVAGSWLGPDGLRLPAELHATWNTDGHLIHASHIQVDESIPPAWLAAYDAFLIDVGYRSATDPGELTGLGFGVINHAGVLRPKYRLENGEEWFPDDGREDGFILPLNGTATQRSWPPSNGPSLVPD